VHLDQDIRAARQQALANGKSPSWFVLFKSQTAAAIASSTILHAEDNLQFQVRRQQGPRTSPPCAATAVLITNNAVASGVIYLLYYG
jgi:hypothetical protein